MAYFYLFGKMWRYAEKDRYKIVIFMILHTISSLLYASAPLIFAQILNAIQKNNNPSVLKSVSLWILIWISVHLLHMMLHRLARYLEFKTIYRAKKRFMLEYYAKIMKLPLTWHADNHSGDIINRINLASSALYDFSSYQFHIFEQVIFFIGASSVLLYLDPMVFGIASLISFLTVFVINYFDKKLIPAYQKINKINHRISAGFYDFIGNIRTIVTLRLGDRTYKEMDERIEDGYKPRLYIEVVLSAWKWTIVPLLSLLLRVGVVFFYIYRQFKINQTVLIGNTAAVFQYLGMMSETFKELAKKYQDILRQKTEFEEIYKIPNPPEIHEANSTTHWHTLAFKNISFEYSPEKQIIKNISFEIKKGDKIALVGESGAGKSTLMALLRGLYTHSKGNMYINQIKHKKGLAALSKMTTLMPQEPEIFENTIEYNITLGMNVSRKKIQQALKLSCFDKVIKKLPNGLKADIREKGVNLSGGEKQRLALARNILAAVESDIILMDEPTSSVDVSNEKAIYEGILKEFKNKTIVSSIHKLYLLPLFDYVIIMKDGKIIEQGPYNTLKKLPKS